MLRHYLLLLRQRDKDVYNRLQSLCINRKHLFRAITTVVDDDDAAAAAIFLERYISLFMQDFLCLITHSCFQDHQRQF